MKDRILPRMNSELFFGFSWKPLEEHSEEQQKNLTPSGHVRENMPTPNATEVSPRQSEGTQSGRSFKETPERREVCGERSYARPDSFLLPPLTLGPLSTAT